MARTRRGTKVYTPKRTLDYEKRVAWKVRAAMQGRDPIRGPVAVTLRIYRKTLHRVDGSNVAKSLEDSMNGIIYEDDAQIVEETWFKLLDRDNPRVEIEVEELEPNPEYCLKYP